MQLKTPIIDVVLDQGDGTYLEAAVQTDNRDMVRWDLTRGRRQWPQAQDAPFLWGTFLAWAALTRAQDISEDFETFEARCLAAVSRKEQETPPVDPTQTAAESAS